MLLLDALYICESGGLRLLMYLVRVLQERNLDFYLLADNRAMRNFGAIEHVSFLNASLRERKKFYERHKLKFSSVLCFGNIPAPIKMNVPVYTYFHNINLLTLSETHSTKEKIKSWLKREVFKFYKNNTDYWLVQTSNTSNELIKHLNEKTEKVKLMPFYELSEDLKLLDGKVHGYDYIFVSDYTGAKGHEEILTSTWYKPHFTLDST